MEARRFRPEPGRDANQVVVAGLALFPAAGESPRLVDEPTEVIVELRRKSGPAKIEADPKRSVRRSSRTQEPTRRGSEQRVLLASSWNLASFRIVASFSPPDRVRCRTRIRRSRRSCSRTRRF